MLGWSMLGGLGERRARGGIESFMLASLRLRLWSYCALLDGELESIPVFGIKSKEFRGQFQPLVM